MLIVIQFAFADLRAFQPDEGGRLPRPAWAASPADQFVRGLGAIQDRRRRASLVTQKRLRNDRTERFYADVTRSISIKPIQCMVTGHPAKIYLAFTRIISDGFLSTRLEFGFRITTDASLFYSPEAPRELLATILGQAVVLRTLYKRKIAGARRVFRKAMVGPLGSYPSKFRVLYAQCTTARKREGDPIRGVSFVLPTGMQALFVLPASPIYRWLRDARIDGIPETAGFDLAFANYRVDNRWSLDIWFLGNYKAGRSDQVRRLRLHLLRLIGELRALGGVHAGRLCGIDNAARAQLRDAIQRSLDRLSDTGREVASVGQLDLDGLIKAAQNEVLGEEVSRLRTFAEKLTDLPPSNKKALDNVLQGVSNVLNLFPNMEAHVGDKIIVDRSSNVSIKATLTNVQQNVGSIPAGDDAQKMSYRSCCSLLPIS